MKISVLITTYNAEAYLVETLDSVLQQSYDDFEIVIVDDGSTDATKEIIREYSIKYAAKIRYFELEHRGRERVLAYAVKQALGDWVAIVDADDLWHQDKLRLQVKYIKKFNLYFLATGVGLFEGNARVNLQSPVSLEVNRNNIRYLTLNEMIFRNQIAHSSVLLKKELALYDKMREGEIEDYDLWLRLLSNREEICLYKEILTFHRIHSKQSFEAKRHFLYTLKTLRLQMKYSFKNLKFLQLFLCPLKMLYHVFLNRKVRMFINKHMFDRF